MLSRKLFNSSFIRPLCEAFEKKCICTSAHLRNTGISDQTPQPLSSEHGLVSSSRTAPLIINRKLPYLPKYRSPKEVWLESLSTIEDQKLGLINLHPDVFGAYPRIDILHENIKWQQTYKKIDYRKALTRAEVRGGGRKPWAQKGMGKARHGSIRSPIWKHGGKAHGPRGPQSFFYMLATSVRTLGLRVALSVKLAQNDLHIVDSLEMPSDEKEYLEDLMEARNWGLSILFIDDTDMMPRNIALATDQIKQCNLMPVYGLNVYSMLKHEKLVLTVNAVEKLEEKLLYQMHKMDRFDVAFKKST